MEIGVELDVFRENVGRITASDLTRDCGIVRRCLSATCWARYVNRLLKVFVRAIFFEGQGGLIFYVHGMPPLLRGTPITRGLPVIQEEFGALPGPQIANGNGRILGFLSATLDMK